MKSGNSHSDPSDPPDPPEVVAASAPQNLPSTCAGGQDDGSLNKLPQIMTFVNLCFSFCVQSLSLDHPAIPNYGLPCNP